MSSSIIRGSHVVTKITGPSTAEVIEDGAVFQRDGEIVEIGPYDELSRKHHADEPRDHDVV